jgi:ribosomal protein S18 acetylase RimI-like enzyme
MKEQAWTRAFKPEDYDEVIVLWRESGLTIKPSDTLPEIKKLLALPANVFLIAEANPAEMPPGIVGSVIGAWDGRRAWIYHLAVKPVARRARIGSGLMSAVEQALRGHGATKINLLVEPGNQQAAEFYRALGYSDQPLQFFSKNLGP